MRSSSVVFLTASLLIPGAALACDCAQPPPATDAMKAASTVFAGRVMSADNGPGAGLVRFEVSHVWKGGLTPSLSVFPGPGDCAKYFEEGEQYLVYAYGDRRLTTSECTRTSELYKADADIAALGPGIVVRSPQDSLPRMPLSMLASGELTGPDVSRVLPVVTIGSLPPDRDLRARGFYQPEMPVGRAGGAMPGGPGGGIGPRIQPINPPAATDGPAPLPGPIRPTPGAFIYPEKALISDLGHGTLAPGFPTTARQVVVFLAGPERDAGDVWVPVTLSRDGTHLTLVIERYDKAPLLEMNGTPARHIRRPLYLLSLGDLDAGSYTLKVEIREFAESRTEPGRYNWTELRTAAVPFPVIDKNAPMLETPSATTLKTDQTAPAALPENAGDYLYQPTDPVAKALNSWRGLKTRIEPLPPQAGLTVGTFDLAAWNPERSVIPLSDAPQLVAPREGSPIYASVLGPALNSGEWMTLRSVEWKGRHIILSVDLWQDSGGRDANISFVPFLLVPLVPLEGGPQKLHGSYTVEVVWNPLRAPGPGGLYAPQPGPVVLPAGSSIRAILTIPDKSTGGGK